MLNMKTCSSSLISIIAQVIDSHTSLPLAVVEGLPGISVENLRKTVGILEAEVKVPSPLLRQTQVNCARRRKGLLWQGHASKLGTSSVKQRLSQGTITKAARGLAGFCLVLFLAVYAMVAVPGLHTLAHHDARDTGHECAVTLFAHGQVHCASTVVDWVRPIPLVVTSRPAPRALFVTTDLRLLPSRGPPGLFFL